MSSDFFGNPIFSRDGRLLSPFARRVAFPSSPKAVELREAAKDWDIFTPSREDDDQIS